MANCSINLNELQQASGCPDDSEMMLFIGVSGFSGFSGLGLREWDDLTECTISGFSGYSGKSSSGFSGYSGISDASGYSGFSGDSGVSTSGYSGYSGFSGLSGISGKSGVTPVGAGESGYSGISGGTGASGDSGYSGISGDNPGLSGYSGKSGYSGFSATALDTWRSVFTTAYQDGMIASSTSYGQLFGQLDLTEIDPAVETRREYVMSEDGTLENFYLKTTGTQPLSGTLVVTVRVNFVDTALAITVAAGGTPTISSNIIDTVPVLAGDIVTIRFKNNATATSIALNSSGCSIFKV